MHLLNAMSHFYIVGYNVNMIGLGDLVCCTGQFTGIKKRLLINLPIIVVRKIFPGKSTWLINVMTFKVENT